jgi:hypothetical protein
VLFVVIAVVIVAVIVGVVFVVGPVVVLGVWDCGKEGRRRGWGKRRLGRDGGEEEETGKRHLAGWPQRRGTARGQKRKALFKKMISNRMAT